MFVGTPLGVRTLPIVWTAKAVPTIVNIHSTTLPYLSCPSVLIGHPESYSISVFKTLDSRLLGNDKKSKTIDINFTSSVITVFGEDLQKFDGFCIIYLLSLVKKSSILSKIIFLVLPLNIPSTL